MFPITLLFNNVMILSSIQSTFHIEMNMKNVNNNVH